MTELPEEKMHEVEYLTTQQNRGKYVNKDETRSLDQYSPIIVWVKKVETEVIRLEKTNNGGRWQERVIANNGKEEGRISKGVYTCLKRFCWRGKNK